MKNKSLLKKKIATFDVETFNENVDPIRKGKSKLKLQILHQNKIRELKKHSKSSDFELFCSFLFIFFNLNLYLNDSITDAICGSSKRHSMRKAH